MFEVIIKAGEYTLADQKKDISLSMEDYRRGLHQLINEWQKGDTPYLSLLMDTTFEEELMNRGFYVVSTIVEHERSFTEPLPSAHKEWQTLEASGMSDGEFSDTYAACKSGSANKNQLFTMDQIMESLRLELGSDWRKLAMLFYIEDEVIGLTIPHIEVNTISEGRLFYFGIMPEWRGKGLATRCHAAALHRLKELGASCYVGSTDKGNIGMIRVMEANGAPERDRKGIYRLDRN